VGLSANPSEVVLEGQLEETSIGSEVSKEVRTGNLTASSRNLGVRWSAPRRCIEQIEDICAELQVLPFIRFEVLLVSVMSIRWYPGA
jgi:hypothetical protein